MNQRKSGIIIQYINIIVDFGIAIFFTPFLLRSLGDAEYGLYRIVQSFAGQLSILTFGIATLVARNIVRYDALGKKKEKENFLATSAIITCLLAIVVLCVGGLLSLSVDALFDRSLSAEELFLAKKLYWLLIINVAVTVIRDMASGILIGHEKFLIRNGLTTVRHLVRVSLLIILLNLHMGALAVVMTDLLLSVLIALFEYLYAFGVLKERVHFYYFDKEEIKNTVIFSSAIFLQAIVNQVNQNLDIVILGSLTTTEIVAMYSIALHLFTMFNSITMVFGTVFMPKATKMITNGASSEELTQIVVKNRRIKPGRFALMIGGLIVTGFILFGREFISFWVGNGYSGAYWVAIILMIPGMLPLMQNVTNSILDAMMKRMGRSLILLAMAFINVVVSIILIRLIGYIGAAFGTAISYIIGYLVFNTIYLKKTTKINVKQMYIDLLSKNIIVSVACLVIGIPMQFIRSPSFIVLLLKVMVYSIVYFIGMYKYGMREYERRIVNAILGKVPLIKNTVLK